MEYLPLIAVGISSFVAISISMANRKSQTGDKTSDDLWGEMGRKVDKEFCQSFKTRIGGESDRHQHNIMELKDDISEIKEGVAFLKGKMT